MSSFPIKLFVILTIVLEEFNAVPVHDDTRFVAAICDEDQKLFQCLGAVVHLHWVLTIKQCHLSKSYVSDKFTRPIYIYAGSRQLSCERGQKRRAHHLYNMTDVQLVHVNLPFSTNPNIALAKLPTTSVCDRPCKVISHSQLFTIYSNTEIAGLQLHSTTLNGCSPETASIKGSIDDVHDGETFFTCPVVCGRILSGFVKDVVEKEYEVVNIGKFANAIRSFLEMGSLRTRAVDDSAVLLKSNLVGFSLVVSAFISGNVIEIK